MSIFGSKKKGKKTKSKKSKEVMITARIKSMKCEQSDEDESLLICDIVASDGEEEFKDKIAIVSPKLLYQKKETKKKGGGKKKEYYLKEIEVEEEE